MKSRHVALQKRNPAHGRTASALAFTPLLALSLTFSSITPMAEAEEAHVRKPPPPPEEIAKLPEDGGPEFNRLVFSQSPYLLQHARNPVDWYPWGEEAFAKAKAEGKPVFLSVGYTTCHWCHVMEHESFEDEEVAALINEHYVAVKVDREERPDIDEVYMAVTQGLTGSGGWPMTVIMTPDKKPFFAGTYFPKNTAGNRPGIMDVLEQLHGAWSDKREEVTQIAEDITTQLQGIVGGAPGEALTPAILGEGYAQLESRYDAEFGGFSGPPKFPVPPDLMFVLRHWKRSGDEKALAMVEHTLQAIHRGGVYDQVGLGVHRYATDREWLLPHFEKMLYDQALLVIAALETYQATGNERYAELAREILTYVLRDMTSPEGGFYSAEDADSEGEEGKFYVWSIAEVKEVLGDEAGAAFAAAYGFTEEGNFLEEATRERTGTNIPHLDKDLSPEQEASMAPLRAKLFEAREKRIHPQKDDKILTDWNGLMIAAFARAGAVLEDARYTEAAHRAADFALETLSDDRGRLLKRYRQGEAGLTAHLEDYAFLTWGLLETFEAGHDPRYLEHAIRLTDATVEHFWDEEEGGFFMTADDAEELLVRTKKLYGGAIPSGNAVSLLNLTRLHRLTGSNRFRDRSEALILAFSGQVVNAPASFPLFLSAVDFHLGPSHEIVIAGDPDQEATRSMLRGIQSRFLPNKVVILRSEGNAEPLTQLAPYTTHQKPVDGKATAYVCQDFACHLPTTDPNEMVKLLTANKPAAK